VRFSTCAHQRSASIPSSFPVERPFFVIAMATPSTLSFLRRSLVIAGLLFAGYVGSLVIERPALAQLSYNPPSFASKQTIGSAVFNRLFNTIDSEARIAREASCWVI
jgi:hypothetical protein